MKLQHTHGHILMMLVSMDTSCGSLG